MIVFLIVRYAKNGQVMGTPREAFRNKDKAQEEADRLNEIPHSNGSHSVIPLQVK